MITLSPVDKLRLALDVFPWSWNIKNIIPKRPHGTLGVIALPHRGELDGPAGCKEFHRLFCIGPECSAF